MRKYCKYRKKRRRKKVVIAHSPIHDKPIDRDIKIRNGKSTKTQEIGFWKSVWAVIVNKEPKNGMTTAMFLAVILAWVFNVLAFCAVVLFGLFGSAMIFELDWTFDLRSEIANFVFQLFLCIILLGATLVIALLFRAMANDIKAEKDRNYISTLFFGFTSLASLIVALVSLL